MQERTLNRLLVVTGSFLISNGTLLLLVPKRFATLRRRAWMPARYNELIDRLTVDRSRGRKVGSLALALGLLLLLAGVGRTETDGKGTT